VDRCPLARVDGAMNTLMRTLINTLTSPPISPPRWREWMAVPHGAGSSSSMCTYLLLAYLLLAVPHGADGAGGEDATRVEQGGKARIKYKVYSIEYKV